MPVPQAPEPTQSIRGAPLQKGCGSPCNVNKDRRSSRFRGPSWLKARTNWVRWRLSAMLKARYVVDFSNHASSLAYCQKLYREQHNENTSCWLNKFLAFLVESGRHVSAHWFNAVLKPLAQLLACCEGSLREMPVMRKRGLPDLHSTTDRPTSAPVLLQSHQDLGYPLVYCRDCARRFEMFGAMLRVRVSSNPETNSHFRKIYSDCARDRLTYTTHPPATTLFHRRSKG